MWQHVHGKVGIESPTCSHHVSPCAFDNACSHLGTILGTYADNAQHEANLVLQEAIKACWQHSGNLKEVHFVLFGSDTLNVWLAQADKLLQPVVDTTEKSSVASPLKDDATPMDTALDAQAGKDDLPAMAGTAAAMKRDSGSGPSTSDSSPAKDEPSAMTDTAAPLQASKTEAIANKTAQGKEVVTQGQSVHTLTGVKEGAASEASQEALGAPEVLEAAPPANYADPLVHSASQDASQSNSS
ncbi:hypothetical protein ABBQ32_004181 [Trebouxia sp. C0010 RCD-2024]